MERHVEVIKHKMHILRGKMLGRTLLPIPTIAGKFDLNAKTPGTQYVLTWYIQGCKMENQHTHLISDLWQIVSKTENSNYIMFLK